MGIAGSFFDPQPWNFGKLAIFKRCSNDIITTFWNSLCGQTCQKCQEASCPGNPEVHDLERRLCWSFKSPKKEKKNSIFENGGRERKHMALPVLRNS